MNEMAIRVTSDDGTAIAYDREGSGPAVILVGGVAMTALAGPGVTTVDGPTPGRLKIE